MRLLLDTHLLLWAAQNSPALSFEATQLIENPDHALFFSVASLWEIVIKKSLGRPDFDVDPQLLRRGLLDNGYEELPIFNAHVVAVGGLPSIHRDPFDRLLIAQASSEGMLLLTSDATVAAYKGPTRLV